MERTDSVECDFCAILSTVPSQRRRVDTVMLEQEEIVVIPALGALEVGHVLVLTKRHYTSYAEATREARTAVDALVSRLRRPMLVWEHGSVGGCGGGACLEHAHVSILPTVEDPRIEIELEPLQTGQTFDEAVSGIESPYILLNSGEGYTAYEATEAPSQLVRRMYCKATSRDDWDWALFPADDMVDPTLTMWTGE